MKLSGRVGKLFAAIDHSLH